ncbi:MAG TPA: FxSxx-COOH cyclophane-containing RiPP peptide [Micromonosporaceae bacterium]|nr:FxSxx-COOH cyclophane-containing RiPP peptide [Micromonosporaceae bacterium]
MTTPEAPIRTGIPLAAGLPLHELLALREAGDSVLDHCLRRVVESATAGAGERVAAFNASPPRRR